MELDAVAHSQSSGISTTDGRTRLYQYIEQEGTNLLGTLRFYLSRTDLCARGDIPTVAMELLDDVVVEALKSADRFDPARPPRTWLLGIAAKLILRRQEGHYKRRKREPLVRDIGQQYAGESDSDFFDRVSGAFTPSQSDDVDADMQAQAILTLVAPEDQQIIRRAVLHGYSGEELGRSLGTSASTARVRLSRALGRLRVAWQRQIETSDVER